MLPSRRCVTLVDDEPMALDVLMQAAKSFHFDCQTATSAETALELLERLPTPIVVTDLCMPGMGGLVARPGNQETLARTPPSSSSPVVPRRKRSCNA